MFGTYRALSSPLSSLSPRVYRSMALDGRELTAPQSHRFNFVAPEGADVEGPAVAITSPSRTARSARRASPGSSYMQERGGT